MAYVNKATVIIGFIVASFTSFAQQDFIETKEPVTIAVMRDDGKQIAFAGSKYIYLLDVEKFTISDSIKIEDKPNHAIASIKYVESNPNAISIKFDQLTNYGLPRFKSDMLEYVEDSIYSYDLTKKELINPILPGNSFMTFAKNKSGYVLGYNNYFEYPDSRGGMNKGSQPGEIIYYPDRVQAPASGVIKNIQMAPNGKELAIMYYDSINDKGISQFSLELRTLPELDIKKRIPVENGLSEIIYTEDSKYIALKFVDKKYSISPGEELEFFRAETLELLTQLPEDLSIPHLVENGAIWRMKGREIVNYKYGTDEFLNRIWNNLTPFFSISRFFKLNENELIIYGVSNPNMTTSGKSGFVKFSLEDEAIFTEVATVKASDSLFNPNEITIQNNTLIGNYFRTNSSKTNFLTGNDKSLQIWSTKDRMKLYEVQFEQQTTAFLGEDSNTILAFEKYQGKRSNEFVLNVIDIETGTEKSKVFSDENLYFSPIQFIGSSSCKCANDQVNLNKWICFDGYGSILWEVDTESMAVTELMDLKNEAYQNTTIFSFQKAPNSNYLMFGTFSDNHDTLISDVAESDMKELTWHQFDLNEQKINNSKRIEKPYNIHALSGTRFAQLIDKEIKVFDFNNNNSTIIHKNDQIEGLRNVLINHNAYYFIYSELNNDSHLKTIQFDEHFTEKRTFNLPYFSGLHFMDESNIGFEEDDQLHTYFPNLDQRISWQSNTSILNLKEDVSISDQGKLLFRNEWVIDLKTLDVRSHFKSFRQSVLFRNSNKRLFIEYQQYNVDKPYFQIKMSSLDDESQILWESEQFEIESSINSPNRIVLADNDQYAIIFSNTTELTRQLGQFYFLNLKDFSIKKIEANFTIDEAAFSHDYKKIILNSRDGLSFPMKETSFIYDVTGLKLENSVPFKVHAITAENEMIWVDYDNVKVGAMASTTIDQGKPYYARSSLTTIDYFSKEDMIIGGDFSGNLFFWNRDNPSPFKTLNLGDSQIASFIRSNDRLFVLLANSEIKVVDLNELQEILTLIFYSDDERISMVWITPDGQFKAAKKDIRNFHFVKNGKAFPMLSYELFLNRPDVILENLGYADEEVINIYRSAYKKRLKRNGFSESTDYLSISRPQLTLINQDNIDAILNREQIELNLTYSDNVEILKAFINGVPVHDEIVESSSQILNLALNYGENNITILAINDQGVESDPITLKVNAVISRPESKVYYVGIGVSKYADSTMNLRFADKDVRRMSSVLSSLYENRIQIDTLTNEQVNKATVGALKKVLTKTSIDDVVIVSFSGHGLIDDNSDFYFAAHDMDFADPEKNGISYYDIQNLLTDIPARRKLLLLDACHSGEIDLDEQLETKVIDNSNVKQYLPEGAKGSVGQSTKKKKSGLQSSFELMQSLFYDLDRGNGSYVISAAGGREFAFESEDWGNGVFTYSFINGLYEAGRTNFNDKNLSISELKDYMYNSVQSLTNGEQKPTARAENIEWDWILLDEN